MLFEHTSPPPHTVTSPFTPASIVNACRQIYIYSEVSNLLCSLQTRSEKLLQMPGFSAAARKKRKEIKCLQTRGANSSLNRQRQRRVQSPKNVHKRANTSQNQQHCMLVLCPKDRSQRRRERQKKKKGMRAMSYYLPLLPHSAVSQSVRAREATTTTTEQNSGSADCHMVATAADYRAHTTAEKQRPRRRFCNNCPPSPSAMPSVQSSRHGLVLPRLAACLVLLRTVSLCPHRRTPARRSSLVSCNINQKQHADHQYTRSRLGKPSDFEAVGGMRENPWSESWRLHR